MRALLLLLILTALSMTFADSVIAQNTEEQDEVCRSVEDARSEAQSLKECDVDRQMIGVLREQLKNKNDEIVNLTEKLRLKEEEGRIKDEMAAVKDQMIINQQKNFEQMKDVADRALKLAETKKPTLWDTWGPLGAIGIILVTIASVL